MPVFSSKNRQKQGLPGGPVVKNSPANAGDASSDPGSEKIPRAAELISPCVTASEPVLQSPELQLPSPRATTTEAWACAEAAAVRSPHTTTSPWDPSETREKLAQQWRLRIAKNKQII